jgi:ribose transport system substrate-binding protein
MKANLLLPLGFSTAALFLTACGPQHDTSSAANPSGKASLAASKGTIGVSLLTLQNPFFKVIGDNLTAEIARHGYNTLVLSADQDVAKQANQVKDFIVLKVAAIVLSPCESRSMVPVIQEANAAGIPVLTVDIPCHEPGVKILTQVATDNYGGGKEAAAAMIESLGPAGGKVAILHYKQAESCRLRVKGFREIIDAHNAKASSKIDLVMELEGGGAKEIGYRAAADAIEAHADLRGLFAINDPSALGARAALEKAGKAQQVTLVGFDGQPEGKQAIKEGKIYADPIQFPDRMGIEVARAIVSHFKGQEVPQETLIPTRLYRQADAEKDPDLK